MASVENAVTVTTTSKVNRSCSRLRGSTAEMASAADAPQMALAPPDSRPCLASSLKRRARPMPSSKVLSTQATTVNAVLQPDGDLLQRNARAQQRHAQAQNEAGAKLHPWANAGIFVQKVEGHADQEGVKQLWPAVLAGDQAGGHRDHGAQQ